MRLLVTFYSVSSALLMEGAGRERGFFPALIPVPRALSSSCGYAVEMEAEPGSLADLLEELHAEWEAVYRPAAEGYEPLLRSGETRF